MTKYCEIIQLSGLGLSQTNIALSCNASKTTVNKVLKAAREQNLLWPLDPKLTDPVLGKLLFPDSKAKPATSAFRKWIRQFFASFKSTDEVVDSRFTCTELFSQFLVAQTQCVPFDNDALVI